jgi:SAM-dependent methyltransferase
VAARWVQDDAAEWNEGPHDAVLCVGVSHLFGGLEGTLDAVRRLLRPGGRVLLGDTIWERPPSEAAQQALAAGPDDFPDLAGLVDRALAEDFEVLDGHVSTPEEWDDYEWAWTGALTRWATSGMGTAADRAEVLEAARRHRRAWLAGYREELGFACLVLQDLRTG